MASTAQHGRLSDQLPSLPRLPLSCPCCLSSRVSWLCRSSFKAKNSFQPQSLCTCGSSFLPGRVPHYLVNCCCCLITKSCPPVCDSMDCSPPGSSAPWDSSIFFSRGSSQPRDQTQVSCISCTGRRILNH